MLMLDEVKFGDSVETLDPGYTDNVSGTAADQRHGCNGSTEQHPASSQ